MIEMLQQPKIQPGNAPKQASRVDPDHRESRATGKADRSFDQHLKQQVDRAPAKEPQAVSAKKTNENQSVDESAGLQAGDDALVSESPEQLVTSDEVKLEVEAEVLELAMVDVSPEATEESLLSETDPLVTEQILPLDGNELPPEPVAVMVNIPETAEQNQEHITPQPVAAAAKSRHINLPQPGIAEVARQLSGQDKAVEQPLIADDTLEFKMPEMKMQAGQQSTTVPAGGKLNALFASVAAAASSSQQVPVTTGFTPLHLQTSQLPTSTTSFLAMPGFSSSISAPVQQQGAWAQGLTDQMAFMVQGKFQTAEMKLNPAHLGPMEIKLSMQDDKASVTFVTQHAAVREALDIAMPRLREMFESQGLNLANVDVSQYSEQNGQASEQLAEGQGRSLEDQESAEVQQDNPIPETIVHINGQPGLSLYA